MPSYRYTREIKPEDLEQQQAVELEGKDKAKNWWHYHWKIVLAALLVLALVVAFIVEMVRKEEPDLTVGILYEHTMPEGLVEQLQEQLGEMVGDVNGDGKVVVDVMTYTVSVYPNSEDEDDPAGQQPASSLTPAEQEEQLTGSNEDPYTQMAGIVQLSTALGDNQVFLFIVYNEDLELYQNTYQMFTLLPEEMGGGYAIPWDELPGALEMDLNFDYWGAEGDGHSIFSHFSVGIRDISESTKLQKDEVAEANLQMAWDILEAWRQG